MRIQLSDHFSFGRLLRFTLPSIVMMIFTSIYSMVDGLFVSNFVGITQFAALNLIFPFVQILSCVGFMFGTGGSALVSATLGAKNEDKANNIFSMLTYISLVVGMVIAAVGIIFIRPISVWMGADKDMLPYCVTYGRILLLALPLFMLQLLFQSFLATAEKPGLGLLVTVIAGVANMILDAVFILVFKWGLAGAAAATAISQCIGGLIPLIYFSHKNSSLLRLGKMKFDGKALFHICTNGLSELVTNISMSVVSILYNFQLMKLAGENGVAAYGAVMYINFTFTAIIIGYSMGVAPVIGYHYGAQDQDELKRLFRKSNTIVIVTSIVLAAAAFLLAEPMAKLFVGNDPALWELTVTAFRFFSLAVLFAGFSIFGSAFFTALNNGVVSAAISFLRTLVFQILLVLVLPIFLDLNGVWLSLGLAEVLATIVTFVFYKTKRSAYHY
ncbi:MAG: MATE family efflux transporter [Oscillospiraceae bacterium]|nr:MATE family efflux transporter [Oscillospiraceae bacterium]